MEVRILDLRGLAGPLPLAVERAVWDGLSVALVEQREALDGLVQRLGAGNDLGQVWRHHDQHPRTGLLLLDEHPGL